MKNIIYKIFILLFLGVTITSCDDYIEGYDVSPNSPTEVTPQLLLTASIVATQNVYTGQLGRMSAVLMQQMAGTSDQMTDVAEYRLREGDNTNEWGVIYEDAMETARNLKEEYGEENPYYAGIANVVLALNLGLATDIWGDVPFTEALQGRSEVFNPTFEQQQEILNTIQGLLDEAITHFNKPSTDNNFIPGADDIIFQGDVDAWERVAYMLKARYAIRLTKQNEDQAVNNALDYLNQAYSAGLEGNEQDLMAQHGVKGNELNQWYAFILSRPGYMKMGANFVNMLKDMSDPRLPFYASEDTEGGYSGTPLNSIDKTTSDLGPVYNAPDAPLPLITFAEMKFIEAEANFRKGEMEKAAEAYNEGVIASLMKITGEADEDYVSEYASADENSITLEKIMRQKYLALFTQPEVWADWRRTGIPSLTPDPASGLGAIPRRLPTPLFERLYNENAIVVGDILTPVWWDAQ